MLDREQLAWAAGLFEGEGTAYNQPVRKRVTPAAVLAMTDEEIVRRFHEAIGGLGKVFGPYQDKRLDPPKRKPHWQWRTTTFEHAQQVLILLWPLLGERRRAQVKRVLKDWRYGWRPHRWATAEVPLRGEEVIVA